MKIKLLKSHRGWETGENWYPAGAVIDLDSEAAQAMIVNGWAEAHKKVVEMVNYSDCTYAELRSHAKEYGVSAKGKRADLVRRLNAIS